jgi:hypothetical protein
VPIYEPVKHMSAKDDINFGMAMIQTLESAVMDRRILGQIVEWLQIPEIQVEIFFIVEFGYTFLLEQFYRSEQADAEFVLGEGFRLHRMPLTAGCYKLRPWQRTFCLRFQRRSRPCRSI